jgi:hypothetical protein
MERTIAKHKPQILCEFNPRCLTAFSGIEPTGFAEQIFSLTSDIQAIEYNGLTTFIRQPKDLIALWETKNAEAARSGHLPSGMLHFDLLFRADR